jgi:hypothetical protein
MPSAIELWLIAGAFSLTVVDSRQSCCTGTIADRRRGEPGRALAPVDRRRQGHRQLGWRAARASEQRQVIVGRLAKRLACCCRSARTGAVLYVLIYSYRWATTPPRKRPCSASAWPAHWGHRGRGPIIVLS